MSKEDYQILVVDDEPLIRESLYEILRIEGYQAQMAKSAEEALKILENGGVDIVVTDLKLPQMSGIALLGEIKKRHSNTEVIIITGYGSIETAVKAMKKGAFEYITKPIDDNAIKIVISNIVKKQRILEENKELKSDLVKKRRDSFCGMVGVSQNMQSVYQTIEAVASTNATILISGESGTGKSLIARAIHETDQNRKEKPFVEISCGALSETLLESELFGHVKGAFTGAIKDKEGRFEYAKGGTIFLDEIDAFSLALQVKLLRVLQDGIFERVGDNTPRKADARIIVATNQDLSQLVSKGEFREDLFYRINVIAIEPPPLRERKNDIEGLVEYYIQYYGKANNKNIKTISEEVKKMFLEYLWPGNIRELENAIEGAVIMAKTDTINKWDVPNLAKFDNPQVKTNNTNLKKAIEEPERDHIISVLNDCNWNRNKAAATLGVNRTTLYNKMKKYNIAKDNL